MTKWNKFTTLPVCLQETTIGVGERVERGNSVQEQVILSLVINHAYCSVFSHLSRIVHGSGVSNTLGILAHVHVLLFRRAVILSCSL